ncbi:MAG TPA: YIP1 family protein [Terriglobales bacterium]|nr:YIP1 family protein [Terriglobales bacterium]
MATNPSVSSQEPAPLSEPQRLVDTFIAPSKAFTDLRRNANWWAPFLIIAIVSLLFVYVVDQKVGFRKVAENLIQLQPKQADRIDRLPAHQRQTVMQQQVTVTKIISYAVPVIALGVYAVFAAILLATLKFGVSADIKYKSLFALVVYTRLPELLRALLAILSLLAGVNGDGFNIQNPVATNPGYFVDPSASAVLRALLTPLDVISIWTLILTAIGITCISKVKRGTAFAVVFGWFALVVLARVAIAAATT